MLNVNANLFRIAYTTVSTEETRYYLAGVFIQPHATAGALLVATDGHRLLCIHDESAMLPDGFTGAIVQLDKPTLAACKAGKKEMDDRRLSVDTTSWTATVIDCEDNPIAMKARCMVDGTYPDWRRLVSMTAPDAKEAFQTFNPTFIADFCKVANELSPNRHGRIRLETNSDHGPCRIRFDVDHAFGLLMPVRDDSALGVPYFMCEHSAPMPIAAE